MNFIIMRLCSSLNLLGMNVNHKISVWNGPLGKRRESARKSGNSDETP